MRNLETSRAPYWQCRLIAAALLLGVTALRGQYLTETSSTIIQAPGGGLDYFSIAADFDQSGYPDLLHGPLQSTNFLVDIDPMITGIGPPYITQPYAVGLYGLTSAKGGCAGDVNMDGFLDVVFNRFVDISVSLGNGDGTFVAPTAGTALGLYLLTHRWLAMADVNNDGAPDLLAYINSQPFSPFLTSNINQYPSWPQAWQAALLGGVEMNGGGPRVGDFDGDGNIDLAIQPIFALGVPAITNVLWGNGTGQFTAPSGTSTPGITTLTGRKLVAAYDMNGDGVDDLISSTPVTVSGTTSEVLQVYLGSPARMLIPAGTFTAPVSGALPVATFAADFNRDGCGDLLLAPAYDVLVLPTTTCNFGVTLVLGLPGGQLHQSGMNTPHTQFPTTSYCPSSVVADFDSDGDPDLTCTPRNCPWYYFRNDALVGSGCAGSNAMIPGLWTSTALVGNALFSTDIYSALGYSPTVLAITMALSAASPFACGVYVDLSAPAIYLPGTTDPWGNLSYPLPIPSNPFLHGVPFYAQAAVLDPSGPNLGGLNLALTPARTIIVW